MQRRIVCSQAYDDPSPAADHLNEKLAEWESNGWECSLINFLEFDGRYSCFALMSAPSANATWDKT